MVRVMTRFVAPVFSEVTANLLLSKHGMRSAEMVKKMEQYDQLIGIK